MDENQNYNSNNNQDYSQSYDMNYNQIGNQNYDSNYNQINNQNYNQYHSSTKTKPAAISNVRLVFIILLCFVLVPLIILIVSWSFVSTIASKEGIEAVMDGAKDIAEDSMEDTIDIVDEVFDEAGIVVDVNEVFEDEEIMDLSETIVTNSLELALTGEVDEVFDVDEVMDIVEEHKDDIEKATDTTITQDDLDDIREELEAVNDEFVEEIGDVISDTEESGFEEIAVLRSYLSKTYLYTLLVISAIVLIVMYLFGGKFYSCPTKAVGISMIVSSILPLFVALILSVVKQDPELEFCEKLITLMIGKLWVWGGALSVGGVALIIVGAIFKKGIVARQKEKLGIN